MIDHSSTLDALAAAGRAEGAAVAQKLHLAALLVSEGREHGVVDVATTLSVSTGAAHALAHLGEVLETRLPGVRRALAAGLLDLSRVRVVVDRTESVTDPVVLRAVERQVLDAVLAEGRCTTRGQVQLAVDRAVAEHDPAALVERRRRAVADRTVQVRPGADGMSSVWGLLPAAEGVTLDARLRELALGVCGEDPRTLAQRRADALLALARGHRGLACACGSPVCPTSATPTTHHRCPPLVQVVVDASVLAGATDLPGVLVGHGVIDADSVRALAQDARWQRLLALDGLPVLPTQGRYRPSPRLAAAVRARDGHCRFPGCTVPAAGCDLDHVVPHARGGETSPANLACVCRRHHGLKTATTWSAVMDPDATLHWQGLHGQRLHSVPTGMPPSRAPVLPAAAPPPLVAPVERPLPGAPAADTWTDEDFDDAVDALVREHDRRQRPRPPGPPNPAVLVPTCLLLEHDEPPPF